MVMASASASVTVDARTLSVRPEAPWCAVFQASMAASTSSGWCTTRSGPSPTRSSSAVVMMVAISRIRSRDGSRPLISMSIHKR